MVTSGGAARKMYKGQRHNKLQFSSSYFLTWKQTHSVYNIVSIFLYMSGLVRFPRIAERATDS